MPDHLRKKIRDAVAADLLGLATTGQRVYSGRAYNVQARSMPALLVYTRQETSEVATAGRPESRTQERELRVVIEARASAREGALDDLLDDIALQVEQRLAQAMMDDASNIAPLVIRLDIEETDSTVSVEGEAPIGELMMVYQATYASLELDPSQVG